MGVARAAHITAQLLAAGLRPDLPAAVVSAAHTARQQHAATTLGGLPDCIKREELQSPALLVIGEVAAHAADAAAAAGSALTQPLRAQR
jgi:uroporphyrin-III C-methyltransferase